MRNAQQLSASLRQGKTGTDIIGKLHTMSPQEQKATLAALRSSYPAAWKAYQQAKAQGVATPASRSTRPPAAQENVRLVWAKTFATEFVRGLVQDTPTNLGKIKNGALRSGKDTLQGLLALKDPKAVAQGLGKQFQNMNRQQLMGVTLVLMASGMIGNDPKAAQQAIGKMTAKQWNDAQKTMGEILSDPEKISYYTTGALTAVATDGALGAAAKGVGTAGRTALASPAGQRAVAGAGRAATRVNQGLDNIATAMFPGGPKGPGGLAVAGGGSVGGTVARTGGGGLNIGPVPKGLAGAGVVGTANLMAKNGSTGVSSAPKQPGTVVQEVRTALKISPNTRSLAYAEVNVQGLKEQIVGISGKADYGKTIPQRLGVRFAGNTSLKGQASLDAERKILEDLRARLSPTSKGEIDLFLDPSTQAVKDFNGIPVGGACEFCSDAIMKFREDFPGIKLNVSTSW